MFLVFSWRILFFFANIILLYTNLLEDRSYLLFLLRLFFSLDMEFKGGVLLFFNLIKRGLNLMIILILWWLGKFFLDAILQIKKLRIFSH